MFAIYFILIYATNFVAAEIFYCYHPTLTTASADVPECERALGLRWIAKVRLCCGPRALAGRNAVNVYERVERPTQSEDNDDISEIELPKNCQRGFFIANFNRRLCPMWTTNVAELDMCCSGGAPDDVSGSGSGDDSSASLSAASGDDASDVARGEIGESVIMFQNE